jgi:hypothetical protein
MTEVLMLRDKTIESSLALLRKQMRRFPAATILSLVIIALLAGPLAGRADEREAAAKLVARLMASGEFRAKTFLGGKWLGNGDSYLALEPSATAGGTDIVRYQT